MNTNFWSSLSQFFLEWEMSGTKVVEKIETQFVFDTFFPPENRTVYEIMWENIVERNRPQKTIWRMRIACWMPKSTNPHTRVL